MFERRRWGRRAAILVVSSLCVLVAPAAAGAFTTSGSQNAAGWWSPDAVIQFAPAETWTLSNVSRIPVQHGVGGSLRLGDIGSGEWYVESDTTPSQVFDLDFTAPSASAFIGVGPNGVYSQGWYKDSADVVPQAQDPVIDGVDSGWDHSDVSWDSRFGPRAVDGLFPNGAAEITGASGPTTVSYQTFDAAGNASPVEQLVVDIDSNAPTTRLSYSGTGTYDSATGWWIGGPVAVTATGTDPNESGVVGMQICDSEYSPTCSPAFGSTYSFPRIDDATVQISAVSIDEVDHTELPSSSNQVTIRDDADPPTGHLSVTGTHGQNGWWISPVTLTVDYAFDFGPSGLPSDPFTYDIGNGPVPFGGTYQVTTDGFTNFTARIHDAAGNVTTLDPQALAIDTQPPVVNAVEDFEAVGAAGWDRFALITGLDAIDPAPGSGVAGTFFGIDNGTLLPLDQLAGYDVGDDDLPMPDGTHVLHYLAVDAAGNQTPGSKTYRVDSTPPGVTCSAQGPTVWPTNGGLVDVHAQVSVTDALSGPAGATLVAIQSNVDPDAIAAGEAAGWDIGTADVAGQVAALPGRVYTLVYDGTDVAGNVAQCARQITVPGAPGLATMEGTVTLPDGTALHVDVRRDATGLIGGGGVVFGSEHSTTIADAEILGHNGYLQGMFDDGLAFRLLLDGSQIRLIEDGYDTGWFTPASGSIVVSQDTTPPVLTLPATVDVDATSPRGATATYTVSAKDDVDPNPSVVCAPASGAMFPIGDTVVHCTATDASGNASHGSFTVHVEGAGEQLADLAQWVLQRKLGPGASLSAKLRDAISQLNSTKATCLTLAALDLEVRAQAGKQIPRQDAAAIAADLARIRNVLVC